MAGQQDEPNDYSVVSVIKTYFNLSIKVGEQYSDREKERGACPLPQSQWKLHPCMPVEVLAAWSRWFHFSSYERQGDSFVSHSIMNSILTTGVQYVKTSNHDCGEMGV